MVCKRLPLFTSECSRVKLGTFPRDVDRSDSASPTLPTTQISREIPSAHCPNGGGATASGRIVQSRGLAMDSDALPEMRRPRLPFSAPRIPRQVSSVAPGRGTTITGTNQSLATSTSQRMLSSLRLYTSPLDVLSTTYTVRGTMAPGSPVRLVEKRRSDWLHYMSNRCCRTSGKRFCHLDQTREGAKYVRAEEYRGRE
jgi:hypothetical protein